ncbi:MAG: hypothetical protein D6721_06050, partial [Gammaproteobacteria bacterium]
LLTGQFLAGDALQGLGALSWLGEFGHLPTRPVLRADPVHLRADRDQLLVYGPETLGLNAEEGRALAAAFDAHFGEQGLHLEITPAGRGYLHLAAPPDLRTLPLEEVRGRPVAQFVAGGEDRTLWLKRLTEVQMLFANHAVNLRRAVEGRPTVNGLWLWGEGRMPPPRHRLEHHAVFYTDDPLLRGVARHCGLAEAPAPAFEAGFTPPATAGEHWLFIDAVERPAAYAEIESWRAALITFERSWLQPAFHAVRTGRIRLLDLLPMNGRLYRLRRRHAWLSWRRDHPARHLPGSTASA